MLPNRISQGGFEERSENFGLSPTRGAWPVGSGQRLRRNNPPAGSASEAGFSAEVAISARRVYHVRHGRDVIASGVSGSSSRRRYSGGGVRVSLDSVIQAFQDGAAPEEICLDFPSLDLAKVYSVLAYYLTRRETIDAYLSAQHRFVETTRRELQAHHNPFLAELRQRVAARRTLPPACA